MTLKLFFSAALFALAAAVGSSGPKEDSPLEFQCGTQEPSEAHKAFSKSMLQWERVSGRQREPFTVDVYFHIVSSSESAEDGNISDEVVAEQMDIVNAAYAPHDISFKLVETTRTVNAAWAAGSRAAEMKAQLRQGPYAALNVYVVNVIGGTVLGYCPFPQQVVEGDSTFLQDGCTIRGLTLPGSSTPPFNGGALVHEIGHWMDVYHTFQDGCSPGDRVDDTPAQATAGRECDPNKVYDTCPNDPGTDPIHNWMNYTGDGCWEEFTPGQAARMHSAWEVYRKA
ncbi:hypothetical protein FDECE_18119 [Fusarium decemcellulare]|nr:hypothetical protein FDECE_18119 [Fusarium decemcellulare]